MVGSRGVWELSVDGSKKKRGDFSREGGIRNGRERAMTVRGGAHGDFENS